MNKTAIKNYAIWARRELIERVTAKALQYGITANDIVDKNADSIDGKLLTETEKGQRQALIRKIEEQGFEQVMEEAAYTWFNRFAALRFMEVNEYLPSHIRVFTNDEGEFKPQILTEAIHLELEGLKMDKVYELKNANNDDELFKYLLIVQCNALNSILPRMFQKIEDYTELLLPDNLLREGSVIEQMISMIPEEDWTDQVQIIGWLYQYYNSEPKDKVFADLKKNIKISKENIPAATQLFTPDWIVRYMVENSLGRLWLEGHPNDSLKSEWKYYLDEAEQEPDVQAQLAEIRKEYASLKPEEIRVIDPCMGSGHILCVLFDTLVRIYEDYGFTAREAAAKIVENNLWGLDIDERAAQLSYFTVMMKARQYDRRFLTRDIQSNVYAIEESNHLELRNLSWLGENKDRAEKLIASMRDAKEYGSILTLDIDAEDIAYLQKALFDIEQSIDSSNLVECLEKEELVKGLTPLLQIAFALIQKYDVVITNPPYMAVSNAGTKLNDYVKQYYKDSKADLFAVFMERCGEMLKDAGHQAMITMHSWMFLSSFDKLREKLQYKTLINMAHLGARAFEEIGGEVVQTTAFVIEKDHVDAYKGTYRRLIEPNTQNGKEVMFLKGDNEYVVSQDNFSKIPGAPIAYWISKPYMDSFTEGTLLGQLADSKQGLATSDNNRFCRLWFEVQISRIDFTAKNEEDALESGKKWFPYNKGGEYRKWYGNNDYIVNWENSGFEIKHNFDNKGKLRSRPQNTQYYFRESASWSLVTSSIAAFRYKPYGHIFDVAGMSFFATDQLYYLLAFCNTKIAMNILSVLAPTINFQCGDIANIPILLDAKVKTRVDEIAQENISISKCDWDDFEISWDFEINPIVKKALYRSHLNVDEDITLESVYKDVEQEMHDRFNRLKENEEELNRIFIDIYGLREELSPHVDSKDVSVRTANYERDIRHLISYAVGCMFGRYSLDSLGLTYAGGVWDATKYSSFIPDKDAIIPICDDEYFEDDIVGRFIQFIALVFGERTLEVNLRFIADALGRKGSSREVIRAYFIEEFYNDHCNMYSVTGSGKRPIYWMFDSGKKNGFKCLAYMHRYQPDTIARIRTDYVHEQQARYHTTIEDLEMRIANAETFERVKLTKQLTKVQEQAKELQEYEEKIHHLADQMISIDLDDGMKHNYDIFKDVLAKVR